MAELEIGRLLIHRREQWDLGRGGSLIPLICLHWNTPDRSTRVLCVWRWGALARLGSRRFHVERRIDGIIREANL